MNSLQFHPLFVFLRVDFSHFLPFEGEFFAIFALWVWILCIFHLFSVNFLQFLPFKGEFFAFFILSGWILFNFQPSRVILVIGVFLSGILRVCCFVTNHPFSFGWFVDIFYPSSVYFLQFLSFWHFLGWKWTKIFLVMVNALKFWYLFKWFGLFYLEFWVGVFLTQLILFLLFDSLTFFTL